MAPEPVWTHRGREKSPLPNGNKTMIHYHQPSVLSLYWLCYRSSWVMSRRNLHAIFSSWKLRIISDHDEPQLNFSRTSFGVNPHTIRLNNNPHNSFRNKTCRQTNTPSSQFNLCKETITSLFWSFHSGVIGDFVFWYVTLHNLLSGSKHFKGTSGITHSKHRHHITENCNFQNITS